jgi:hypothetical protein
MSGGESLRPIERRKGREERRRWERKRKEGRRGEGGRGEKERAGGWESLTLSRV